MMKKFLLLFILISLNLALADSWPITVNLKAGKTVLLNADHSWVYYAPPVPRIKLFFHDANFGMTKAQFSTNYESKKSKMKESPNEGVTYFDDVYGGYPATLFFYFKNDVLFHGEAIFKLDKPKDEDYTKAFDHFDSIYQKRYGKPAKDTRFFKEWLVDGYSVQLVLTSQNNRLFLATILEDQQLAGKVSPTPNISITPPVHPIVNTTPAKVEEPLKPKSTKAVDLDQLKALIDAL